MKLKINYRASIIPLFVLIMFCTACPRKPELGESSGPPVMLAKNTKNSESLPPAVKDSAVIVSIPLTDEFFVGRDQYPQEQIGDKISRLLATKADADKIVYLAGAHPLEYGVVANILDAIRREGVTRIGLLVEPTNSGNGPGVLRVQVPPEPNENDDLSKVKPNPLMLVVSISKDLKLELNRTSMGDAGDPAKLSETLTKAFQQRKEQHVYAPGLETRGDLPEGERVEKTVVVKAQRTTRYGDVVRLIDAVKGAGASPIILQIDDLSD